MVTIQPWSLAMTFAIYINKESDLTGVWTRVCQNIIRLENRRSNLYAMTPLQFTRLVMTFFKDNATLPELLAFEVWGIYSVLYMFKIINVKEKTTHTINCQNTEGQKLQSFHMLNMSETVLVRSTIFWCWFDDKNIIRLLVHF